MLNRSDYLGGSWSERWLQLRRSLLIAGARLEQATPCSNNWNAKTWLFWCCSPGEPWGRGWGEYVFCCPPPCVLRPWRHSWHGSGRSTGRPLPPPPTLPSAPLPRIAPQCHAPSFHTVAFHFPLCCLVSCEHDYICAPQILWVAPNPQSLCPGSIIFYQEIFQKNLRFFSVFWGFFRIKGVCFPFFFEL